MATAAARTIADFLQDSETAIEEYDMILTSDLGFTGSLLLQQLMEKEQGIALGNIHQDCGKIIFDLKKQDVNSGGSGCGCSASVVCSHILKEMYRRIKPETVICYG